MPNEILAHLTAMRRYFDSGITRTHTFRKKQIEALQKAVKTHEDAIYAALYADLKKSKEECWVTENGFFLAELNETLSQLKNWMEAEPVTTNLLNLPSSSYVEKEPMGVVLVIGPWNYPFQLLMTPLLGAIAAGNCVVIKPSEFAPATATVIKHIIETTFEKEYILFVSGDGATIVPSIMNPFRFDHVFYTGSAMVGKLIYQMAAEKLIPVTLELGGKSPCVVTSDANIAIAAKRIVMTKFSNAGQMCVATDYILVHASRKAELVAAMQKCILQFFGEKPEDSPNYGRIINEKHWNRVIAYLSQGKILSGGRSDKDRLFIEPTLMDEIDPLSQIMKDEIFGPVLPILSFETKEEALFVIARNPNPLAFYIFTSHADTAKRWIDDVPSGGACVNNASWHLTNPNLPFGGRGYSGTGAYHGKYSFETFSHKKAVMKTPTWFDPALKYPPFKGKLRLFKWIIR